MTKVDLNLLIRLEGKKVVFLSGFMGKKFWQQIGTIYCPSTEKVEFVYYNGLGIESTFTEVLPRLEKVGWRTFKIGMPAREYGFFHYFNYESEEYLKRKKLLDKLGL